MTDENKEELRPSKMRGVAFPKAKYGVILAIIIIIVVWIGWSIITDKSESEELDRLSKKRYGANDHKDNITDW